IGKFQVVLSIAAAQEYVEFMLARRQGWNRELTAGVGEIDALTGIEAIGNSLKNTALRVRYRIRKRLIQSRHARDFDNRMITSQRLQEGGRLQLIDLPRARIVLIEAQAIGRIRIARSAHSIYRIGMCCIKKNFRHHRLT